MTAPRVDGAAGETLGPDTGHPRLSYLSAPSNPESVELWSEGPVVPYVQTRFWEGALPPTLPSVFS